MVRYISLLLFIGLACDTASLKNKKAQSEYEEKVEKELSSSVRNDEIFMTFKFGDSKNDVTDKFRQLKEDGKLFVDEKGNYTYTFVLDEYESSNGYATFHQKFHDGKLYQFRMMVKPHDDMRALGGGNTEYIQLKNTSLLSRLAVLFLRKYSSPIVKNNLLLNTKDYFWNDGNREIEISLGNGFVNVLYTDLFALKSIEQEKKNKMINKAKDTKTDI